MAGWGHPEAMRGGFNLTAQQVLGLPLDELAYRVLEDAAQAKEWNWRNWMNLAKSVYQGDRPVLNALDEAWNWLLRHGVVVLDSSQNSDAAIRVSRRGQQVLDVGLPWLRATERLNIELTPVLEVKARPHFLRGDLETAVFTAMKEVEVEVRRKAGLPDSTYGRELIGAAFRTGGPLHRDDMVASEQEALASLFRGVLGLFKNPSSHREVDVSDATEAAEMVLCADLLLRLLDKIPDAGQ